MLKKTLDVDGSTANSETESMAEINANDAAGDAKKVNVFELSEQQLDMKLKDGVALDDFNVFKAVVGNESKQLDNPKVTAADVISFGGPSVSISEPTKDLNARCSSKEEVEHEHNPGYECKDHKKWEFEEHAKCEHL